VQRSHAPLQTFTPSLLPQHDRTFLREVDLNGAVAALLREPDIAMISFLTASTIGHAKRIRGRCAEAQQRCVMQPTDWAWCSTAREVAGLRLVPMLQWLDSTHIAKVRRSHPATIALNPAFFLCFFWKHGHAELSGEAGVCTLHVL
jgi:hypothetical protein